MLQEEKDHVNSIYKLIPRVFFQMVSSHEHRRGSLSPLAIPTNEGLKEMWPGSYLVTVVVVKASFQGLASRGSFRLGVLQVELKVIKTFR